MKNKIYLSILVIMIMSTSAYSGEILIASGHNEYPPFMWKEGKKIVGVGAELTSIIFGELGIKVNSIYIGPWKRLQKNAKTGEIDLILGIYKNEERLKYLIYPAESYTSDPVVIFVVKGKSFPFTQWKDLMGKQGGAIIGDSFGQKFDSYAESNLDIYKVKQIKQAFEMMTLGRLEYVICGLYTGRIHMIEMGLKNEIEYLSKPVVTPLAYQAFSKESKFIRHIPYFNKRIAELKVDGTIGKLIEKHMAYWEKTLEVKKQ
ncbi:MAG: polar amino acid transport system substrate-binding protein [Alteromonadaceae bacterium]|jgi:polar amino acid transport system substrate-binding protein